MSKRIMALDWGKKRIGWAISDPSGTVVGERGVYRREKEGEDIRILRNLIEEKDIKELVIGLPRNMDGSLGEQADKVIRFKEKVTQEIQITVSLYDERLTTQEAERILLNGDVKRADRKKVIDGISAAIILQGYLESKRSKNFD
jgi:putative Holliday junction resolvase